MDCFFNGILSVMRLKHIELSGFKSFAKKATLSFTTPVTAVVGPNGSGKSNVVEAFRFVLGEQSMKSMRGKVGADLIFRGAGTKMSRAAVSITFDNSDKVFGFQTGEGLPTLREQAGKSPLLFDTVTFTRELFADGTSTYSMNGSEIKLKAMSELLSSINIGTSSHHIISQGEADGILRANPRERREMLEDALGLKIYHFRIKESESKLTRAMTTLKEVQSLRRELAPHLKFLQKQVEKIEKGRAIRTELEDALVRFLATERTQLGQEDMRLREAIHLINDRKHAIESKLAELPVEQSAQDDERIGMLSKLRTELSGVRDERRAIEQKMGRLEGMLEAHRHIARAPQKQVTHPSIIFAPSEYHQIISDIEFFIAAIRSAQSLDDARQAMDRIEPILSKLKSREPKTEEVEPHVEPDQQLLKDTALELESLAVGLTALITREDSIQQQISTAESAREASLIDARIATRARYELQNELTQCDAEQQILKVSQSAFISRKEQFDAELKEAGFMFGPTFLHTLKDASVVPEIDLHTLRRDIDRLKIRLDEHSGIGNDVLGEYESARERDEFLARELADTEGSIRNLESLIIELKKVLDERFTNGVKIINDRFGEFFKSMFGGGNAFLSITLEKKRKRKMSEEELMEEMEHSGDADDQLFERGIDVHVSLPEKKVKEIHMFSGGERSLVSIALLFAISQVNPPPFLVLDETDAALDEANSRKYGDMIERLAEYSQLIVVTHNRETMSRASVLYGVTLGADAGSKLLSIKFDDAIKVAK